MGLVKQFLFDVQTEAWKALREAIDRDCQPHVNEPECLKWNNDKEVLLAVRHNTVAIYVGAKTRKQGSHLMEAVVMALGLVRVSGAARRVQKHGAAAVERRWTHRISVPVAQLAESIAAQKLRGFWIAD